MNIVFNDYMTKSQRNIEGNHATNRYTIDAEKSYLSNIFPTHFRGNVHFHVYRRMHAVHLMK